MSLAFLGNKSFHPARKDNQKRVWVAEQAAKEKEQRERDKAKEVRKAAEALQAQQAAAAAGDVDAARRAATQQVNFLYAAPPGLPETKSEVGQSSTEDDEAVREFRRKVERRGEQRPLERYVGRRAEDPLTLKDQVERFPVLKDAPVEGKYTEGISVSFKPVGLRLRNVRCLRCGDWGHKSGDRECRLRHQNPNDASRQRWEDPVTEINKLKAKQKLVFRRGALPLEMQDAGEQYEILQSDDDEAEDAYLAGLSDKQKRRLRKKLKKQARDDSSSSSDSDTSSHRHRAKKRKASKHKHKHRSKRRSEDERDGSSHHKRSSGHRDESPTSKGRHRINTRRSRSRSRSRRKSQDPEW